MSEFLWFALVCIVAALITAALFQRFRPGWSRRRIASLAALPIPAVTAILCVALFLSAAFSSREACGVDACGMAMMASTVLVGYAVAGFALAVIACLAMLHWRGRP